MSFNSFGLDGSIFTLYGGLYLILCVEDILEAFNRWKFRETLPEDGHKKVCNVNTENLVEVCGLDDINVQSCLLLLVMQVRLMCSYCKKHDETDVPDPYYGGPQGFEKVLYVSLV